MPKYHRFFLFTALVVTASAAFWFSTTSLSKLGFTWSRPTGVSLEQKAPAEADLAAQARAAVSVTQGTLKVAGLQRPVTVLRDRWGVPHIYAESQHDLFFAQGFVQAQDRLFQMELWKRAGQGRLAEILGPKMLPSDVKARLLRYRGPMQAEFASYTPDGREIFTAFTEGINAYIRQRSAPDGPGLPLEFRLAGFAPEPWKPEDCLNRMAALGGNASGELYHAQLVEKLGPEKAARLLDLDPPVKLDPVEGLDLSGLSPSAMGRIVGADARLEFPPKPTHQGSNNWTISGRLTRSGHPLLANDPHRSFNMPSLRYIVHLVAPGWNVEGAVEAGWPGVTIGHNEHIAWGLTIFGLDQQDLYVETLDPSDPLRYKTENAWERMQTEKAQFQVKGQASVEVLLKYTRHGPVVWEDSSKHRVLAMRWVGAEPGGAGYLGSLAINRAQNWQQFEAAMERWRLPSENIVYADTAGNIGEHSVGTAPLRKKWTGLLPVPGDRGYEWEGFVPTTELPHQFNPPSGFIATANHKMIPEGYPYAVGFEWEPAYRARRIEELLNAAIVQGRKLDVEDMARIQRDIVSLPARELVRLLNGAAGNAQDAPTKLLLGWDGSVAADSPAAALYEVWVEELERAVYHQLAPEIPSNLIAGHWSLPAVVLRSLRQPDSQTFGSAPEAERDRLLLRTVQAAAERLRQLQGPDPKRWSWGKLHQLSFRHSLNAVLPTSKALFDLGPLERSGDGSTVNAVYFHGAGFEVVSGASYREIFDLGDWDRSLATNTPGQSGQPGSPHYGDLLPMWAEGSYFPLVYSRAAVEKQTTARLRLEP